MKTKKIFLCAFVIAFIFVGAANALDFGSIIESIKEIAESSLSQEEVSEFPSINPENALSVRQDDSIYYVLRLEDTSRFLKWLLSKENINIAMPLIISSRSSNAMLGGVEIISAVIENTPIKTTALLVGINRADVKTKKYFVQAAFTVDPSINNVVKKISDGTAEARDIAKLVLGNSNPITALAETVIKVERVNENIFRVNNNIFLAAHDGMILAGTSPDEIISARRALENENSRLKFTRRFDTKDFSFIHMDYDTAAELEPAGELDDLNGREFFKKPLTVELGFKRAADKFTMSSALNLREAFKEDYAEKILKHDDELQKVKGGNIDLKHAGGKSSPLAALGTQIDFSGIKEHTELKALWDFAARQLRLRFKISEKEFENLFNGALSVVVNDSVTAEGLKLPALYISQTGKDGAAEKFFEKLSQSQHFSKVHEGTLQMDSSLSPVSFLAVKDGETLCFDFAELSSLTEKPEPVPALNELMNREALSALWVDFTAIQAWIIKDENGVFSSMAPLAALMGYGKILGLVRNMLEAKFSVPSVSLWSDTTEIFHVEFAIRDVDAKDGFLKRFVDLAVELQKMRRSSRAR